VYYIARRLLFHNIRHMTYHDQQPQSTATTSHHHHPREPRPCLRPKGGPVCAFVCAAAPPSRLLAPAARTNRPTTSTCRIPALSVTAVQHPGMATFVLDKVVHDVSRR
jgi:hypothetical protein